LKVRTISFESSVSSDVVRARPSSDCVDRSAVMAQPALRNGARPAGWTR
jgi:hypothetical protein